MDWMDYSLQETDLQFDSTVSRRLEVCHGLGSTNWIIITSFNDDITTFWAFVEPQYEVNNDSL